MIATEKAKSLVDKFYKNLPQWVNTDDAKKCAIYTCDEILIELFDGRETASDHNNLRIKYWQDVKQEIHSL